jgi:4-amino-4-deoxy-L-arabinose transferase-like glycosyltransferase
MRFVESRRPGAGVWHHRVVSPPSSSRWRPSRRVAIPLAALAVFLALARGVSWLPQATAVREAFASVPNVRARSWAGWEAFRAAAARHVGAAAAAGAVLACAWAGGRVGLGFCGVRRAVAGMDRRLAAVALGCGGLSTGVLGLALCGLLRPAVLAPAGAAFAAAGLAAGGRRLRRVRPRGGGGVPRAGRGFAVVFAAAAGLLLAMDLPACLSPEWFYDGRTYHLGLPERFLVTGRFALLPEHLLTFLPLGAEMLYLPALAFGGEVAAKLLNWAWGGALALAAASLARRLGGSREGHLAAGPAAAFIVASFPLAMVENEIAFSDNLRGLLEVLALAWVVAAVRRGEAARTAAAALAGFAMGTKYLSVVPAAALAVWAVIAGGGGVAVRARRAAAFVAVASAVLSPWLARNWLAGRDPVYPFLPEAFDPLMFSAAELSRWMQDNAHYGAAGMTLRDWLTLPVRATAGPWGDALGTFGFGPVLLGLAALACLRRRWPRAAAPAVAAVTVSYLVWSLTSHLSRYLLPAGAAAAGIGGWLLGAAAREAPATSRLLLVAVLAWAPAAATLRMHHRINVDDQYGIFAHAAGRMTLADEQAARGFGPSFRALPAGTVLLVGEDRVLGMERPWRGGSHWNVQVAKRWAAASPDTDQFAVKARQSGIASVLLNAAGLATSEARGETFRFTPRERRVFESWLERLRLAYADGEWRGYVIVTSSRKSSGP